MLCNHSAGEWVSFSYIALQPYGTLPAFHYEPIWDNNVSSLTSLLRKRWKATQEVRTVQYILILIVVL
jgi:hypothetical protein